MIEVIGVNFKASGKVYYFDPEDKHYSVGDKVIIETKRGLECGEVATTNKEVTDESIVKPLKKVIRAATKDDIQKSECIHKKESEAFEVCSKKINVHNLQMKLINVEMTFDNNKITFYFTADGRIDFRELVKDLASVFRTRIELRQVGVRDEAKMLDGIGICGQQFCCSRYLTDFQPVSIKMAKEQSLSLNPVKISGTCGRLMCCLKHEQSTYEDLISISPHFGTIVNTPSGKGRVIDCHLLTGFCKVSLDKEPDAAPTVFHRDDLKIIKAAPRSSDKYDDINLKGIE